MTTRDSRAGGFQDTARFLADASRLLVSSLDWEKTLSSVAELAARVIADWCTVYFVEDDGSIRRIAMSHEDPEQTERCWEVVARFPMDRNIPHGTGKVLRTGRPELIAEMDDSFLVDQARDERHLEWLRSAGMRSMMSVPLVARGRILGALTFVSSEKARYGPEELALAEDFARVAALAIDNARLYRARVADEERLRAILDQMPSLVYLKDAGGRTTLVNRRFAAELGPADGEPFSPDETAALATQERRALEIRAPVEGEVVREGPSGRATYLTSLFPLLGDDGAPYAVCGILTDVTEKRRLEEQLRQAQKLEAIGLLAGGVAHDFNNILTVIKGYGELLVRHLRGHSRLRDYARSLLRSATRASGLTMQLLAFGRKQVVQLEVLDLNEIVSNMHRMLRRTIGEDYLLETDLDPGVGAIRADSGQVEQVILNLVLNARDAMPGGGRITLSTVDSPGGPSHTRSTTLVVHDDGEGMDATTQARIFEPFFTTKPRGRGTGLGLSTVYGIVQQGGGRIAVESAPGRGSTFRVQFPSVGESSAPSLANGREAARAPARETLLVVEDDDAVRTLIEDTLGFRGYTVLAAADGREALQLAREHGGAIDLLVTDVVMPGMSGPEVARELSARRPGLKVLYVSGYPGDALDRDSFGAAESGAQRVFLQKPFTMDALAHRIGAILQ